MLQPRKATIEWFRNARYGMFIHYGLYSLLGRHEWVQYREKIPVAEYAKLKDQFTAEKFTADFITDLALEVGMKYINITTRHHDSFCLWDTKYTDFKSTNSPAKRDLLAEQCNKKGLALFFYYSHGRNWKGIAEKPMEICDTMQPRGWGYMLEDEGKHKSKED